MQDADYWSLITNHWQKRRIEWKDKRIKTVEA